MPQRLPDTPENRRRRCNLAALKLSPHDDMATGVDAVDLEHSLGEIKTNCGNLQ
jgi:hypothetical protein